MILQNFLHQFTQLESIFESLLQKYWLQNIVSGYMRIFEEEVLPRSQPTVPFNRYFVETFLIER